MRLTTPALCLTFVKRLRTMLCALACVCLATPAAWSQTRIACIGEAMTHSAHREYDPEYPELLGEYLDDDFAVDRSVANPMSGGMLHGAGSNFEIGNYGIPKGSGLDHPDTDRAESTLRHPQLVRAEEYAPDVVVIGPYGPHEPYAGVPLSEYATHFRRLVERVLAFESKPIVLVSLPVPRDAVDNNSDRRQIYDGTLQVIEEMNLPRIDLWTPFLGNTAEFDSQNKFNITGRRHHAQIVGDAVLAALADAPEPVGDGGAGGANMGGASTGGAATGAGTGGTANGGAGTVGTATGGQPALGGSSGTDPAVMPNGDPPPADGPGGGTENDPPTSVAGSAPLPGAAPSSEGAVPVSSDSSSAGGCAVAFEAAVGDRFPSGTLLVLSLLGLVGVRRRRQPRAPALQR